MKQESKITTPYKRWYDYDPLLLEVIDLLKYYQDELKAQAEVFLEKIESQVTKESLDTFYEMICHPEGNRWYDNDPVLSKTIELLRIVPPDVQRKVAQSFLDSLKQMGLSTEMIKQSFDS